MKPKRFVFILGMTTLPFCAFAHGEDVLYTIFYTSISIFLFLALLIFVKLRVAAKLILAASYMLTLCLLVFFTRQLPYTQNQTLLNMVLPFGPAVASLVTFFIVRISKKA